MTKIQLRRAWFQVHKWIGLILAVLIIPLCLSGSALVWHDALERIVEPQRFATTGSATLAPEAYVAAAASALAPDARITQLRMPEAAGDPVVVTAVLADATPRPPLRSNVYFDPPTARPLDVADSQSGPIRFLHMLHGSMLITGGTGRTVVGWLGVAMLVSSISGLWLWWPTAGSWRKGLRWRRHRNVDTNLHHLFGFWISLPLFVLSLTGAWISFPVFFGSIVGEAARGPDRAAMARAKPLPEPATGVARAVAAARSTAPGDVTQVSWPTDRKPEWQVTITGKGPSASVAVDDATGVAKRAPGGNRGGSVARWMRQVHDGSDMGLLWQILIFLGGLLPAALAVTGVIMWWRARIWRGAIESRQRGRPQAAE